MNPLAVMASEPSSFWLSLDRLSVSELPPKANVPWNVLTLSPFVAVQENDPSARRLRRIVVPLLRLAENSPIGAGCWAGLAGWAVAA